MKKTNMNVPKETTRIMELPECWISDRGKYVHFKDSKWLRRLPTIEREHEQILKDMNVSFRERQNVNGRIVLEYWDKKAYTEHELTLPLYEKKGNKFIHTGNHTGQAQSDKMIKAAFELQNIVEKRKEEANEAEQAKKETAWKEKYEEVKARLQANKKLVGVGFVSNVIPNFSNFENTMRVFNLRNVVGDKIYPSFYYVAFDTSRIGKKTVIELEVPNGKVTRFMGQQQSNVKYWAGELGVKFIHVVEAE